jgi:7-carboxy-7-deazaguanine synthase
MNAAIPSDIVQSPLERLKITEIFLSLQGEAALPAGRRCSCA